MRISARSLDARPLLTRRAATVRSLGPPPQPGHEAIAEHYFAAVYDRAVTIAGALAAVGGMIEPEELQERDAG